MRWFYLMHLVAALLDIYRMWLSSTWLPLATPIEGSARELHLVRLPSHQDWILWALVDTILPISPGFSLQWAWGSQGLIHTTPATYDSARVSLLVSRLALTSFRTPFWALLKAPRCVMEIPAVTLWAEDEFFPSPCSEMWHLEMTFQL